MARQFPAAHLQVLQYVRDQLAANGGVFPDDKSLTGFIKADPVMVKQMPKRAFRLAVFVCL